MRLKLLAAFVLVVLAGCQSPTTPSPNPVPTSAPTVVPSTEAPTPTPTVSGDQALVEDLVRRYFEVEDKLVEDPSQLQLIPTVAQGEAHDDLLLRATKRIEGGLRLEGQQIRRGLTFGTISQVSGVPTVKVTYCSDNSEVRVFDRNGSPAPKQDATFFIELTAASTSGTWYIVRHEGAPKPC